MKKIEIRSEYPCLLKWKNSEQFLDEASSLCFDTPECFFVYPATGKRGDIAFVLDLSQLDRRFCQTFNLEDRTLCLLTRPSTTLIKVKEKVSVQGKDVSLTLSNSQASFETDERIVSVEVISPKTYELSAFENFAILKIKGSASEQIVVLNLENYEIFCEEGNIVEFDRGEISCQKNGKEEKFSLVNGHIVRAKIFESPPKNPKIIPLKFLEKIKNHDYKSATAMMWDSLNASEEKLSAYFGEIKKIVPLSFDKFLIVKKAGHYIVKLDLLDEKISNIEILD